MERVVAFKASLRDTICVTAALHKKYDWLLDEIGKADFGNNSSSGFLYKVSNEWMIY
jgi:hypothetical protein